MQPRDTAWTLGPDAVRPQAQNRRKQFGLPPPAKIPGAPEHFERYVLISPRPLVVGEQTIPACKFVRMTDYTAWYRLTKIALQERVEMVTMPEGWKPGKKDPEE